MLDTATVWGQDVADAIAAVGVTADDAVTPAQLALIWKAIKQVTIDQMAQADVAPGSFQDSTSTNITGVGGPVT